MGENTDQDGNNEMAVNRQIVEAVEKSTDFVFGMPQKATGDEKKNGGDNGSGTTSGFVPKYNAGTVIAYDKVAQAAAFSVQDATDYQRNMLSIFGAAQGKAIALMIIYANKKPPEADNINEMKEVIKEAQTGATVASTLFGLIGTAAVKVVTDFPK